MSEVVTLIKDYKDLVAWHKSMDIVEVIYDVTKNFPREEVYGLTSQMRRAAVSIPSNIAEGSSRDSTKEFIRFIDIANGSLKELETQVLISMRLRFINNDKVKELFNNTNEIGKILFYLKKSLLKKLT